MELWAGTELQTLTAVIDVFDALSVKIAGADDDSYPSGTLFRLQAQTSPDGSRATGEFVSDLQFAPGTHDVSVEVVPRDAGLKEVDDLSATASIEIEVRSVATPDRTSRGLPGDLPLTSYAVMAR